MDWSDLWLFGAGALAGWAFRPKAKQSNTQEKSYIIPSASAHDRDNILRTYIREISNHLVRVDPDRYLRTYGRAMTEQENMKKADKKTREAQLHLLTERYPTYDSFDVIGTRPYIIYADTLASWDDEDLEVHLLDMVRFHAIKRVDDAEWRELHPIANEEEREHLYGYIQKIKDTRFKRRMVDAVREYYAQRSGMTDWQSPSGSVLYETPKMIVFRVEDIAETCLGVFFKDTQEHGLYTFFAADDDRTYEGYYRSDRMFKERNYLDTLHEL
jgi:hypothetical protein